MVEPLPFEELFRPLVLDAEDKLHRQVKAAAWELLTSEARTDWSRHLLIRLTAAGSKAAHWQFQIHKTVRSAFPAEWQEGLETSNALYRHFVGARPRERLRKLFDEFPALAELCAVLVENWLATVDEFLTRLQADCHGLNADQLGGKFSLPVARIQAGLSDLHLGGRSVVRLCGSDGTSLIYKPRSLAVETHFAALLDQLNACGTPYVLKSARCWDRSSHGWMEDVKPTSCHDLDGVRAFYWRAGALLGLIYLAGGVDFHRENLIAAGEFPVLIDLEALRHPQNLAPPQSGMSADSILRTGFLPRGEIGAKRRYDWGALSRKFSSDRYGLTWVRINEDDMCLQAGPTEFYHVHHLPKFEGQAHLATGFEPEIQAGFGWVGKSLLASREQRAVMSNWLRCLDDCPRRQIRRPTIVYQEAISRFTLPQSLRGGEANWVLPPETFNISEVQLRQEIRALKQMDVPYFRQQGSDASTASVDENLLSLDDYLKQSSFIAEALATRDDSYQSA